MSLATRCTHCGTIFKVVEDQLKVSEGWVRCGRCQEVFHALPSLFDLEKDPPPPRPAHLITEPPAMSGVAQATPGNAQPAPPPYTPSRASAPLDAATSGMAIPLSAMPDVRAPASAERNPLIEQGLISDADVDLGFDSKPPSGWAPTQPADDITQRELDENDLALDPAPIEATTDFELDTAIAVDDNTPLEDVLASMAPRQSPSASRRPPAVPPEPEAPPPPAAVQPVHVPPSSRAWLDEPPEDVPNTDEEDALDSRYLMPSPSRDRKPQRRLEEGPEFADAQFPSDAFIDAEEDWASDFGPSALDADAPAPLAAPPKTAPGSTPLGGLPATQGRSDVDTSDPQPDAEQDALPESVPVNDDASKEDASGTPTRKGRRKRGEASEAEPEFLKHAQRKAFWRHPATRGLLSVLMLALLAVLGLQLAHQYRDLIVAYQPATRPLLAQWCELAQCRIQPPLRIESLQVESATLVRAASEGPDSYRLTVVVHNRAPIGLAWPHVDLTLTDTNGTVIARRVFSPQDAQWLDTADPKAEVPHNGEADPAAASTPEAAPGQRSTTLQWRLLAPDIQPAGYTAELFYP